MEDISEDLIREAATGSRDAFERIYRVAAGFVYAVAVRMTNNVEDAEEVTQDVFVSIYRNLPRFEFRSSFKTWVYRITVNFAINVCRKHKRRKDEKGDYEQALLFASSSADTSAGAQEHEQSAEIQQLLGLLSEDQRACLVLRAIEGLSYEEIAHTLKININTVRSRLKRARETLLKHKKGNGDAV